MALARYRAALFPGRGKIGAIQARRSGRMDRSAVERSDSGGAVMAAPLVCGKRRTEADRIRRWGAVVAALAATLADSPNNVPLADTMLQACEKLRAAWYRARHLNSLEGR